MVSMKKSCNFAPALAKPLTRCHTAVAVLERLVHASLEQKKQFNRQLKIERENKETPFSGKYIDYELTLKK